jgi:hypothetical protein
MKEKSDQKKNILVIKTVCEATNKANSKKEIFVL